MGFLQFLVFLVMIAIYVGISGLLIARLLGRYKAIYTIRPSTRAAGD